MAKRSPLDLGKRERQIVETVYRLGEASVAAVRDGLDDPPGYSAVRAMLGLLVDKGVLKYRREGKRYLYRPSMPKDKASKSALQNLLSTFFGGQATEAVAALLDVSAGKLSDDELDRMTRLIEQARKENR